VGAWSGLGAIGGAVGPFLGGWIVGTIGWRWIFFLNLPLAAAVVLVALRHVPETRDTSAVGKFDVAGALLAALALTGIAYALIEVSAQGLASAVPIGAAAALVGAGFVLLERRRERSPGRAAPMLPLSVFASRQFTAVNVVTFVIYAALGGMLFLLILNLQVVSGFSPLAAGASLLPMTLLMLTLSPRTGALAQRIGPRWLMAGGPLISSAGLLLGTRIGPNASYVADVLPAVAVFGLGLSATVAPLTATVLASADVRHAGVASGVNNAVARAAGLLAVAGLPLAVGLSGPDYHNPVVLHGSFQAAMVICAGLLVAGAVLSAVTIDDNVLHLTGGHEGGEPEGRTSYPMSPPLEPGEQAQAG
jgi:Major Facilitator Superfamily